jgi:hypothetical protein
LDAFRLLFLCRYFGGVGQLLLEAGWRDQRGQDHKDDQQDEQHVGEWRDVDLRHHFLVLPCG